MAGEGQRPEIRPLERGDLEALVSLMEELSESARTEVGFSVERFEPILQAMGERPELYSNLVAVAGGEVVGFVSVVYYRSFFHRVGTALINELVVARAHRGAGVGSLLIEAVKEESLRRAMDEIEVGTEKGNRAAQGFYHSQGFAEEYLLLGMELPAPA